MFRYEEGNKELEIISSTIDERCESESIYEGDDHEVPDIRSD
jgi:hypothetical protein